jgi:predicted TIM-barrel fold metal-dependent hydrolase
MTTKETPAGDGERLSESDQQWFDRLAGRTVAVADAAAVAEADAIRVAFLRRQKREQEEDAIQDPAQRADDDRKHQQLLFEARRRGILGAEKRAPQRRLWLGGMAAALALGVLVVFQLNRDEDDGEFRVMGGAPEQVISASQPRQRAEQIARELESGGVTVRTHAGRKTVVLEIEVPPERFEALKPVLEKAGVQPRPGQVFVRVVPD